ncbi:cadherin EGF LAG seven-pass G-type receptor 1-like [Lampris incognitus]|uniref:cadherin EGF LAG seven-pass G-type receptor 1-like n=1 Tax=Lampris incognitus TaxID=2546036 RepID=UPI0024B529E0|nr:cadherin EGF LAG seven-pass G-type receptor 1-like [Lampris incognitus]
MTKRGGYRDWRWRALWWHHFFLLWSTICGQTRYTIPEEPKQGYVVGNLAKDLGLGLSEMYERNLRVTSEAGKQYFSVDAGKGELVVNERIDREALCGQSASCVLSLQVVIQNPLQLYRVEVEIQDINDNSPSFPANVVTLEIAESTAAGTRFRLESAQDLDVGSNYVRSYSLSKDDCFNLNIKDVSGGRKVPELVLAKPLDREKKAVHQLLLTALDGGNPVRSGTARITIKVLDNNDNFPVFEKNLYKISLTENSVEDTSIVTLIAKDIDEGPNGEVEYFFGPHTSDTALSVFDIDSSSGKLTLKGRLDFESVPSFELHISAKDKGTPRMEGDCTVQIEVVDYNDNAPEIVLTSQPNPVREDAPTGTVIALISARDFDSGENGKVKLQLPKSSPFSLKPSFSNNYALVTSGGLDRESFSEYNIELTATDAGSPPLSSQKTIPVTIIDVNDNPPVFSQPSYNVYIKENTLPGSILYSVSASDLDFGDNAKISYSILDSKVQDVSVSSYVYINSDNGSIYSMHSFDYEKLKVFQIQVQAKDQGSPSLSSNATVHVFILDQNDNAPSVIYPSPAVLGSLSHQRMPRSAKAGHLVTKVTAVDADSGHNAWISYKLSEATDASLFTVSLYTGEVRTKRAVSEQDDSSQRLLIEIKDDGEPVQSATVTVSVLIEDGLHEPILDLRHKVNEPSKKSGRITLYLILSLAGVSVLSVLTFLILAVKCIKNSRDSGSCCMRRSDCDDYKNPNRNLQIQLNTDGPIKYVEVLGGDMMSQSQSFRSCLSPMSEYSDFTLVKPSSTTDFKEMISVLDASLPDSTWTFESQQVSRVLADPLQYHIDGQRHSAKQSRMTKTGGYRDWRWRALWWHHFFLLWSTIDGQTRYTIPEELKQGSVVGNLAKDVGLGLSEMYERNLRVASEAGKQYFSVDAGKGELVVNERIDREALCGQSASCVLPLQVVIENPLQLHRIEVEIRDINDNSPSFLSDDLTLKIPESAAVGTSFPLESAQDPDVGSNSLRSYTLSKNECFSLRMKDIEGGRAAPQLVLEKQLDREKTAVHSLSLTALDGGSPVRSGSSQITIIVLDINDNFPVFEKSVYKVTLAEKSARGNVIIKPTATDADEGSNAEIEYSFGSRTPASVLQVFEMNSVTGEIVLKGDLDYETTASYGIDITAKDKGSPEMEGHCRVQVDVMDINDNAPEIVLTSQPSAVREDAPSGTVVALISVRDLDSGDNSKVSLQLPKGSPFSLKPSFSNNYALVTSGVLDRESFSEYKIDITATDAGSPPLSSKKTIPVTITDVNDNPAVFSQPSYNVYIKENTLPGSILYSVSASDLDFGDNAKISYSILDSKVQDVSVSSYVYINSDNGSIYSMHSFDYEKLKVFQIQVQAKDRGSPSLSSNATVHVFILDQNDNAPSVIYPSPAILGSLSHQRMPRSAKAGHLVTKVTAVDADSGHNAWISYKLSEATDASLFTVSLYTGEVRTKRAVSEQDDSSQRLLIEIKDDGEPVQSATVTVSVLIEDGLHEPILDLRHKVNEPSKKSGRITLYLILSLAGVSVLSVLTFLILAVKCIKNSRDSGSCCMRRSDCDDYKNPNRNLQIQLNTDGPIKYVEVLGGDMMSQSQSFRSCLSPMSEYSDFTLVKPSSTTDFKEMISVLDASLPDSTWTFESQQVSSCERGAGSAAASNGKRAFVVSPRP